MRSVSLICAGLILAGCSGYYPYPGPDPQQGVAVPMAEPLPERLPPAAAIQSFADVIDRVEPVAEGLCRARTRSVNCDIQIFVDTRPGLPANAFQTVDKTGRPIVVFTSALIADARNADEIAFVMGHEAAHHIAGHLPRRAESVQTTAILAGVLAQVSGAAPDVVRTASNLGAEYGARAYSKDFELEADALGTEIAYLAGFDPLRGAAFFSRLPDPGDQFLGSHPPNAQRQEMVRRTVQRLK